jgi:hypothetical protein
MCYDSVMARIAHPLLLQPDQVLRLESLLRLGTLELRVAKRFQALLLAADGLSNVEIGTKLDMHRNAISNIRTRFQQIGLDCLEDAHRLGKPSVHCLESNAAKGPSTHGVSE